MLAVNALVNTGLNRIDGSVQNQPSFEAFLTRLKASDRPRRIAGFKKESRVYFLHSEIPTRTEAESAH